jgi:hypothetical protein
VSYVFSRERLEQETLFRSSSFVLSTFCPFSVKVVLGRFVGQVV